MQRQKALLGRAACRRLPLPSTCSPTGPRGRAADRRGAQELHHRRGPHPPAAGVRRPAPRHAVPWRSWRSTTSSSTDTPAGDLIVGTPVAGRARPELQDVVGVSTPLPIRTQLDGAISFAALFDRVRDTCIAAMEHGDYPIERMIADVNPERSGRNPLFDTMLVLGPAQTGLTLGELRGKPLQMDPGVAKARPDPGGLRPGRPFAVRAGYNTHLFHAATIRRMAGHLQRLAELTLAEPSAASPTCPCSARPSSIS